MTWRYARKSAITNLEVERQILDDGYGVKFYKYYSINPETGEKTLLYTDKFIVNPKGGRVRDERGGLITVRKGNTISQKGCYIFSIADVTIYDGNTNTPADIDVVADHNMNIM